jgi:IS5 family transposase
LVAVIEPHYPKGSRGRPPIGLERMLRMYIAQNCFGLSDEGIEWCWRADGCWHLKA